MVAAGNLDAIKGMHPALRSRIRGYGYEVYMAESMEDNEDNRRKYIRFIAQEVKNDAKIPTLIKVQLMKSSVKRNHGPTGRDI